MSVRHKNHRSERIDPYTAALLAAALLGLCVVSFYNYLLFHSLVEVFTVTVAWSVFFLAWNGRRFLESHYILLIGISALFVGVIDLFHALAYKGAGIMSSGGANHATQFWVAARGVQSLSFLVGLLFLRRKLNHRIAVAAYAAVVIPLIAAIVRGGIFPDCFVEGSGLTRFKVFSEYGIAVALMVSAALLYRGRSAVDRIVFTHLLGALALTIFSELAFSGYENVFGVTNTIGHLLRFAAFCLLCRALVVTGMVRPADLLFRNLVRSEEALRKANAGLSDAVAALKQSDERYRALIGNSSEGIWRVELGEPTDVSLPAEEQVRLVLQTGRIAECNDVFARLNGKASSAEVVGTAFMADPQGRSDVARAFVASGYRLVEKETCEPAGNGALRWLTTSMSGVIEDGRLVRIWGAQRDITEAKSAALERERLISDLQHALAEVKRLSGLLPICANCKKIRDDQGYWQKVENYLAERAGVSFTHGICPECSKLLYADLESNAASSGTPHGVA
jgi:PAS domain-containing protein